MHPRRPCLRTIVLLVVVAWAVGVAGAGVWLSADGAPPREDGALHLARLLRWLAPGDPTRLWDLPWPPMVYLGGGLVDVLGGRSIDALAGSSVLWLLPMLAGMSWLGARLAGTGGAALMLSLTLASGWSHAFSRHLLTDPPAAASVILGFAALVASEGLRRRGPCAVLGLAVGVALLSRWSTPIWLAPPIAVVLLQRRGGLRRQEPVVILLAGLLCIGLWALGGIAREGRSVMPVPGEGSVLQGVIAGALLLGGAVAAWKQWHGWRGGRSGQGLGLVLGLSVAVAGPWYALAADVVHWKLLTQVTGEFTGTPDLGTAIRRGTATLQATLWLLPVWIGGGLLLTSAPIRRQILLPAAAGLAVGVPITLATAPAGPRYLLPAIPLVLVLAGAGWTQRRVARGLGLSIAGVLIVLQLCPTLLPASLQVALDPRPLPGLFSPWRVPLAAKPGGFPVDLSPAISRLLQADAVLITLVHPARYQGLEPDLFEVEAHRQGGHTVWTRYQTDSHQTWPLTDAVLTLQARRATGSLQWPGEWDEGKCWEVKAPDHAMLGQGGARWCVHLPQ